MNSGREKNTSRDEQLAARFAQLRRSELADLPVAPSEQELLAKTQSDLVPVDVGSGIAQGLGGGRSRLGRPSLALAAAILFATVVVLQMPSQQADPADLYLDVMAGSAFTTDPLMQLSTGLAPESTTLPRLFDVQIDQADWAQ
ncbi:MAG: hypothetical protein AB8C02_01265 [Halioglobus sp.]